MIEDIIKKLSDVLHNKTPEKIDLKKITDENILRLSVLLNQLFVFLTEIDEFIVPLSKGKLDEIKIPSSENLLASPFKELHSRLLHLTWQTKEVANGDYSQRVDFMGDFSDAFNSMIISLDNNRKRLKEKIEELENALQQVTKLESILPICANCKKIRIKGVDPESKDNWVNIESYITKKTETKFSHSICPDCKKKLYPDYPN
jgi:methyl-accepting chemotaxis protein